MRTLCIILAMVGVALAAHGTTKMQQKHKEERPKRCCMPNTYQIGIGGSALFAEVNGTEHGMRQFGAEYGQCGRCGVAAVRMFTKKGPRRIVMNYKKHELYIIGANDTCRKEKFEAPPPARCLPESAKFVFSFRLGAGWRSLDAYTWEVSNETLQLEESVSFTRSCVPIGSQTSFTYNGTDHFMSTGYFNMKPRIEDRSLFHLPDSCKNATMEDFGYENSFEHQDLLKVALLRF